MIALVPVFGVLAGLLGVLDTIPYVRDMVRGTTRPHRGTWLIWSVLGCTVCFSQGADGATWSLVMAATQAVLTTGIFLLSLRWGDGGVSTGDWVAVGIAGTGVVVWLAAEEPLLATACVVAVDLVAVLMMVPKTYRDPHSEAPVTFALGNRGHGPYELGARRVHDVYGQGQKQAAQLREKTLSCCDLDSLAQGSPDG